MGTLRLREVKCLAQGHRAAQWCSVSGLSHSEGYVLVSRLQSKARMVRLFLPRAGEQILSRFVGHQASVATTLCGCNGTAAVGNAHSVDMSVFSSDFTHNNRQHMRVGPQAAVDLSLEKSMFTSLPIPRHSPPPPRMRTKTGRHLQVVPQICHAPVATATSHQPPPPPRSPEGFLLWSVWTPPLGADT